MKKKEANVFHGDLTAQPGVVYPYTEITGWVYASGADTRTAFPALTTVGGWVDARGADTRTAFPALTTVGGGVDASGADTRTAFPALTTKNNEAALIAALSRQGLDLHDGILSRVVRRRGAVTVVQRIGSAKRSYVVTDGPHYAHGDTLAEARADLRVKQQDRDTSAYADWTPTTKVSLEDAITAYRVITGACGAGVRAFLATRQVPSRLTVARAISETAGQYGHDVFAAFFAERRSA